MLKNKVKCRLDSLLRAAGYHFHYRVIVALLLKHSRSTQHLIGKSPKHQGFKYILTAIALMNKLLMVSSISGIFQYLNDLSEILPVFICKLYKGVIYIQILFLYTLHKPSYMSKYFINSFDHFVLISMRLFA